MHDWQRKPIGELFNVQLGKMLSAGSQYGSQYQYLANRNVQWGQIIIDDLGTMNFSEAERDRYRLQSGDLLVCEGGEVGRAALWSDELPECYFQNAIHRLRATGSITPHFMRHYFEFSAKRGYLRALTGQTSIGHLPRANLVRWAVPVPPVKEQKRIAEILDTLDEAIQAIKRVISKLDFTRRGIQRNLLRGHFEGARPEDWKQCRIGDLASFEYGSALHANSRTGQGYPVYGSNGVVGYHAAALVDGPGIIVGRKGSVGALAWSETDYWPIDTAYWVKPKVDLDIRWMIEVLKLLDLKSLNSSTGVPGLNRNDVYELTVHVPPLREQQHIARILDAADETVQVNHEQLDKLREMRSGLADDLLSGRVRTTEA